MARSKKYNPEKRTWRGRSYKRHGKRVADLVADVDKADNEAGRVYDLDND